VSKHPCRAAWTRVLGATHKHGRKVTQGLTPELRNVLARTVLSTLLSFRLPVVPSSGCCRRYGSFALSTNSTWCRWPFRWSLASDRSAPSKLSSPTIQRCQYGHLVDLFWTIVKFSQVATWVQTILAKGHSKQRCCPVFKGPLQSAHEFWWGHSRRAKLSTVRILFWVRIQVKTLHLFSALACQMSWFWRVL